MLDEITRAVLSRDEIAKYLEDAHGESGREARERIQEYLEELRTTQRYSMYRALKHPVYLLLRNVERIGENIESPKAATRNGRVVYISNHRSHCDYLVEPLVLDDNGVRPPVIAAGINLFGGQLPRSRVPDDAEGVRRRAAPQARPVLLPGGRAQLQR
jgi:glycerol-3-phosphate O-acyltransferase